MSSVQAGPRYSVDTSSLVNPWAYNYRPQAFVGFWERLEGLVREGALIASEEVHQEIKRIEDGLFNWCKAQNGLFVPHSAAIQDSVKEILKRFPRLVDSRKGRSAADPFVIAVARVSNCFVVTEEDRTGRPDRPKIPDVCEYYQITVMKIADVIAAEGWTFR